MKPKDVHDTTCIIAETVQKYKCVKTITDRLLVFIAHKLKNHSSLRVCHVNTTSGNFQMLSNAFTEIGPLKMCIFLSGPLISFPFGGSLTYPVNKQVSTLFQCR